MKCNICQTTSDVNLEIEVCLECRDFHYFQSDYDLKWYPRQERISCDILGGYVTIGQKDEHTVECVGCDECILVNERNVGLDGESYCLSCYDEAYFPCSDCGETADVDDSYYIDSQDHRVCPDCNSDNYRTCYACDWTGHIDNMNFVDSEDEWYCESCEESNCRRLRAYNYVPDFNYYTLNKERELFFGLEIELDCDTDYVLDNIEDTLDPDKYYFKEDGSINGFEIVTHPMTFEKLKKENFRSKLETLSNLGAKAYSAGNCGLHIHVSKNEINAFNVWKMIMFFAKCQSQVIKISQRTGTEMSRWCKIFQPEEYRHWNDSAIVLKGQDWSSGGPYNMERYAAINCRRSSTIEFRIFRGTLGFDRFWASVEFVNSLVHFMEKVSYKFVKSSTVMTLWNTYVTYVIRTGYHKTLLDFLKSKGLITNKPKLTY